MKHAHVDQAILQKIRHIAIRTQRLLRGSMAGDERSAIKGTGFEFDQMRDYQFGDDVRFIDWKASSRLDTLVVKQYIEERTRTVIVAVDVSASGFMGSQETLKRDIFSEIAAVLTLVTSFGKDRIGTLLFSHQVEKYIAPARGMNHAHAIIHELYTHQPKHRTTRITSALKKIAEYKQKDAIVFVISDFIDETVDFDVLGYLAQKHDIYALRCLDHKETDLDLRGFIPFEDPETGQSLTADLRTGDNTVTRYLKERVLHQNKQFRQKGVPLIDIKNSPHFIADLIRFFRRKMQY